MWFLILLALMVPASAQSPGEAFSNAFAAQQALRISPYAYDQLRQQQMMREQQQMLNRQQDLLEENNRLMRELESRRYRRF